MYIYIYIYLLLLLYITYMFVKEFCFNSEVFRATISALSVSASRVLTLFRMGLFRAAHEWEGGGWGKKAPLSKMCYTYATVMKPNTAIPHLKKIKKIHK